MTTPDKLPDRFEQELVIELRLRGYLVLRAENWLEEDLSGCICRVHQESGERPTDGRCGLYYWNALRRLAAVRCCNSVLPPLTTPFIELYGVRFEYDPTCLDVELHIFARPR